MAVSEVPAGQIKGPIPLGPSPVMPCGPCSLEALQAWERAPKATRGPMPNMRGVKKRHLRRHLRQVHGVDLAGDYAKPRRQGCTHRFTKSLRCELCRVTMKQIAERKK